MSLARLMLRAAWVGALKNKTIAENRVFDTRLNPLEITNKVDLLPCICVYTDHDTGKNIKTKGGDPLPVFERQVDLIMEITVGAWHEVEIEGPQGNPEQTEIFDMVETDAELEALLDFLELQIKAAFYDSSDLSRRITHVESWESVPGRSTAGNTRQCARLMTIRCLVVDECMEALLGLTPMRTANPSGATALPVLAELAPYLAPFLTDLARIPAFSSLRAMLGRLNGNTPLPAVQEGFSLGMKFAFQEGATPAAPGEAVVDVEVSNTAA